MAKQAQAGAERREADLTDGAAVRVLPLRNSDAMFAPSVRGKGTCIEEARVAGCTRERMQHAVGSSWPNVARRIHKKQACNGSGPLVW